MFFDSTNLFAGFLKKRNITQDFGRIKIYGYKGKCS
jgi:hypothetical protein